MTKSGAAPSATVSSAFVLLRRSLNGTPIKQPKKKKEERNIIGSKSNERPQLKQLHSFSSSVGNVGKFLIIDSRSCSSHEEKIEPTIRSLRKIKHVSSCFVGVALLLGGRLPRRDLDREREMKLWKRAAGALKDQNSLFITGLSRRTLLHNRHLDAVVIKATSHDDARVDYRNAQRVFAWVRTSPSTHLKPLVWAISSRAHRTRSWPVALKCLMLLHGVFCCKVPAVHSIGRLPFDLSDFADRHSSPSKTWGHNALIRAYFNFLDQKSVFLCTDLEEIRKVKAAGPEDSIAAEITMLQRLQSLLALLLQVRPQAEGMRGTLVLEAMDSVIIEIFDTYSKVCNMIARVLSQIYGASQAEASAALVVLRQANAQGDDLAEFFEFCKFYGVLNASAFPKVERIPEEDIREVERMVNGGGEEVSKAMVVREGGGGGNGRGELVPSLGKVLQTVVTSKWEVFDDGDDLMSVNSGNGMDQNIVSVRSLNDPQPQRQPHHVPAHKLEIPDLITF